MEHLKNVKDWEKILDSELEISQKIDGAALIAQFSKGKIRFYNRESKAELDLVNRTISTFYLQGIEYLEDVLKNILKSEGQLIAFEYFSPKMSPVIPIIRRPKNNLVLLYSEGISISAQKIGVEPEPIIFKGKLNASQKALLMSGKMNAQVIKQLNPNFKPIINPDNIEGIVIKTRSGLFKITDELFTNIIKDKKQKDKTDELAYKKLIMDMITKFDLDVPNNYTYSPESYLQVIFKNIEKQQNSIISKNKQQFAKYNDGKDFEVDFTDVNWNLIPSVLHSNMQSLPWFKDFVRLLLSNYRKERARAFPGISKDQMNVFNDKVRKLIKESRLRKFLYYNNL